MYRINPNNTVTIRGHIIPFDLFSEACQLIVSPSWEGAGCYETPLFVVFKGIAVVRKEYVRKASQSISFKHIRKG